MAERQDRAIATTAGEIGVRIYRPPGVAPEAPALLYLHGGGFVLFGLDTHDRLMREYAAQAQVVVIGIDYPLSPEVRFPVALHLIGALVEWLGPNGASLGIDPQRLAIAGDSAGANLSVAACLLLRDRGAMPFRAIVANYGFFSTTVSDAAEATLGGPDALLNRDELLDYARNYLRDATQAGNPLAFPLSGEFHNLPATLLVVPELDVLAEQSFSMAARMTAAGVRTTVIRYPGATHSFLEAMSIAAVARQGIADGAAFLAGHLHV